LRLRVRVRLRLRVLFFAEEFLTVKRQEDLARGDAGERGRDALDCVLVDEFPRYDPDYGPRLQLHRAAPGTAAGVDDAADAAVEIPAATVTA
jgi:hypothetical protein